MSVDEMGKDVRYPVGKPVLPGVGERVSEDEWLGALATLAETPEQLRNAVAELDGTQLDTAYREGGWSLREVVHHTADSHMAAFIRMRRALTEDWPAVRPFDQDAWAGLADAKAPVEWSLELIESLHARWVMMLQSLTEDQKQRGFTHPHRGRMTVEAVAVMYAWHSRHHVAHITHLRAAKGW